MKGGHYGTTVEIPPRLAPVASATGEPIQAKERGPMMVAKETGLMYLNRPLSRDLVKWQRLLKLLLSLLGIEAGLAAVIRVRVILEALRSESGFSFLEATSVLGLLVFPILLYAVSRLLRAQKDLRALATEEEHAAERTRVLLDTTADGIYGIDATGHCTMANQTAAKLLGYAPDELIGKNIHELIHHSKEDGSPYPISQCPILRATAQGEGCDVEGEVLWRKDGTSFWVDYSSNPIVDGGGARGAVVTFRSVDERKAMEQQLADSEQRVLRFMEDLPIGVFVTDHTGRPLYSNRASEDLLGIPADDSVEASKLSEAYGVYIEGSDEPYPTNRLPVMRALAGETVTVDDIEVHRPDGSLVPLEVWAGPIHNGAGELKYAAAAFTDVSERKAMEAALRESEEALREASRIAERERQSADRANSAKSEFLSRMSHELRTPLNAILGFAQLLELDELSDEQKDSLAQIIKGGHRLLELINEVLDIARIESGKLRMSLEPVRCGDVVVDSVNLIRPLADERSVTVMMDLPEDVLDHHLMADRQRLAQVLLNLLSNAVKYNVDEGTVSVVYETSDGRTLMGVRDTGPGVPADKIPLLFKPFERLEADETTVEGTGLGLSLSKSLIDAMGGEITVESKQGLGTTFWVSLPTAQPFESKLELVTPVESGPRSHSRLHKVLYIEDNLSNLKLIESILERYSGTELVSAMTGSLGIELAHVHAPDLILLDLHLPDIRGHEALIRLKRDPSTASIPVVVFSADPSPRDVVQLLAAGAEDYLIKPIDVPRFVSLIENFS